ncbi:MAG: acetylglutamate kinase [Prevotellaceae bacterium]|nr:acetylglutamate kinase [Prevotellaceae bacterium]
MVLSIIKIGGNVIDNPDKLDAFLKQFAEIPSPKILVHGGGKLATKLSAQLGIETHMVDGRRITDKATLDLVTMVYAGLINKQIVAKLQALDCNAIGLSGADANIIPAHKRLPTPIDFGFVGDIVPDEINIAAITTLLQSGITPVFCALTHDSKGSMLNSNADSIASALAQSLSALFEVHLVYCFELPGVMKDIEDSASLITDITPIIYNQLRADGIISKGMIPKIDNAFAAIRKGVKCVIIKSSDNLANNIGTTIHL